MKIVFLTISLLFCALILSAQDIITLTNGTILKAKVSEVNTNEIVYNKYNNLDGPTYRVQKSSVSQIKYANGTIESYSKLTTSKRKSDLPKVVFQIDPLGFAQFGPVVGVEFRTGKNSYLDAHFRWLYAGFLYHAIASDFFNIEYEADMMNRGIGFGYKYMLPSQSNNRMYLGALAEHLTMNQVNHPGDWDQEDTFSKGLVFCGDWGYRWHFSKMSLSVGANIGFQSTYYSKYNDEDYSEEGMKTSKEEGTIRPILLAKLSLGF